MRKTSLAWEEFIETVSELSKRCFDKEEIVNEAVDLAYSFDKVMEGEDPTEIQDLLTFHLLLARLVVCDYSFYRMFPDSELRQRLADLMFKKTIDTLLTLDEIEQVIMPIIHRYGGGIQARGQLLGQEELLELVSEQFCAIIRQESLNMAPSGDVDFERMRKLVASQLRLIYDTTLRLLLIFYHSIQEELFSTVEEFRDAILETTFQLCQISSKFETFPRHCCGLTSVLLAKYLEDVGFSKSFVVKGNRADGSLHEWVRWANIDVDITASQYNDQPASTLVEMKSQWHARMLNVTMSSGEFESRIPAFKEMYRIITSAIDI